MPIDKIREYFGETIALMFSFEEHYKNWLIAPSVVGLPFQIYMFASGDTSFKLLVLLAFFLALWAICMMEFWKRKGKASMMFVGFNLGFYSILIPFYSPKEFGV